LQFKDVGIQKIGRPRFLLRGEFEFEIEGVEHVIIARAIFQRVLVLDLDSDY
jgi:hypothetical protein